jgi:TP901-1 family phage major tail protein
MATSGVMNGTLYSVAFVDGFGGTPVKIDLQTDCSISLSMDTRDISNKDSGGYRKLLGGQRSGSITFSSLQDFGSAVQLDEFMATWNHATTHGQCTATFASSEATDGKYSADAILTNVEVSAGTEDNVTISGTLELSGEITYTASS